MKRWRKRLPVWRRKDRTRECRKSGRQGLRQLLYWRAMIDTNERWTEDLTCPRCGKTGVAEISAATAFQDHADLIPSGFKTLPGTYGGILFVCTSCNIPALP